MEQEKQALITLIESWTPENAELALQIMDGNPDLKAAMLERYGELIKAICGKADLGMLRSFPEKIKEAIHKGWTIPHLPLFEAIFPFVPVQSVYLTSKGLTSFPWWIFHLPNLTDLDLSHNNITEIPEKICVLKSLEVLRLNACKLSALPESIGELVQLKKLQLDFNNIEKLPDSIGNLVNLNWLCLENNAISEIPKSASGLKMLSWLSIEGTPLGKKHNVSTGRYTQVDSDFFKKLINDK